jgi:hypothetical protein
MSGTLPAWVERLLGVEAGHEEGTIWSLEHQWRWPPCVTVLFLALAVALVVAIYLREGRRARGPYRIMLAAIRLCLVGIVLLMIAQLALSLKRTGLPYVAVVVDDSQSMGIVDRYEPKRRAKLEEQVQQARPGNYQLNRWNLARTLLTEQGGALLAGIAKDYKLRVYFLEDSPGGVRSSSGAGVEELLKEIEAIEKPSVASSRLGAAVRTVLDELRGTAPAAVVLLSDGINTDGPTLDEVLAGRKGVPLFAVGLGSDEPVKDLKISDLLVDPRVFLNDVVNFELKLTGNGFQGRRVWVVLREQDKPDVLAKVEVSVGPDGQPQQVRLPYRPTKVGRFRYVVEVEPQAGELQTENNRQERTVEVHKEKIRVLLAQGYPSFEFRYLQKMLQREEAVELKWVLQVADLESTRQDASALPVFPVQRDDLFSYDVIILGDVNPALLSASTMQNLADFVDQPAKGGALILIAGAKYMPDAYRDTPLARLMPIKLSSVRYPDPNQPITRGFTVQPTELGLSSPAMQLGDTPDETRAIWRNLPPLYWLLEVPDLKPAARTLAEDPTRRGHDGRPLPVICMQYVGAGKVLFHATDETYRWRKRVGDLYFGRYWIQTIRYLSRSKLAGQGRSATLSADRRQYAQGEPVRLRVRFADVRQAPEEDDGVTVVLEHRGYKTRRIQLHRTGASQGDFDGLVPSLPVGGYHAWIAIPAMEGRAPAVDFTVAAPPGEFERVQMDRPALEGAAKHTGGRFYTFETARHLVKDLPPGHQVPIESLPPKPLWNQWPLLLLFLVLVTTEWILRKVGGMV